MNPNHNPTVGGMKIVEQEWIVQRAVNGPLCLTTNGRIICEFYDNPRNDDFIQAIAALPKLIEALKYAVYVAGRGYVGAVKREVAMEGLLEKANTALSLLSKGGGK